MTTKAGFIVSLLLATALCACGGQKDAATPAAEPAAEAPAAEAAAPAEEAAPVEEAAAEAPAEAVVETVAATSDDAALAEKGRRMFTVCAACHTTKEGDPARVGPNLFGVAGRASASLPDFNYSPAMKAANLVWDDATLDTYLTAPMKMVPGTRMAYAGEPNPEKRAAIIAYLNTLK